MGRREDLLQFCAAELADHCGMVADPGLLGRIIDAAGPAAYDPVTAILHGPQDYAALRQNFLRRKLGLPDGPALTDAIDAAIEAYGPPDHPKHRIVLHYILARHFGKAGVFSRLPMLRL